jgi:hypothetical protein
MGHSKNIPQQREVNGFETLVQVFIESESDIFIEYILSPPRHNTSSTVRAPDAHVCVDFAIG